MLTTPERPETSVHALLASPVALLLVTTLAAAGSPLPAQGPPAHAQPAEASSLQSQPLRFSWTRDGALTAGAAVLVRSTELLFRDALAPETCRWCDRDAQGEDTLNALDQWGLGIQGGPQAQQVSRTWSNVVTLTLLPAHLDLKLAVGPRSVVLSGTV